MLSTRSMPYWMRPPTRVVRARHLSHEALGCIVVRRITDDAGRAWRVREFRSNRGLGLFFRCDVPGVRAETRSAVAPLESLDEDRLVQMLQNASD